MPRVLGINGYVRSNEARGARWSEIDLDNREWRIPSQRMKAGIEHRVPLSAEALNVLAEARKLNDGSGLCFPSPKRAGYPLSPMSLTMAMRSTGLAKRGTVHGFRSSFRMWASECTDANRAVMELSLAHRVGSAVEQAYARSDLLAKRRTLMARWAAYLTGQARRKGGEFQGLIRAIKSQQTGRAFGSGSSFVYGKGETGTSRKKRDLYTSLPKSI